MMFEMWASKCRPGQVAVLSGGQEHAVVQSVLQALQRPTIVFSDKALALAIKTDVSSRSWPKFDLRISRGLNSDLSGTVEARQEEPVFVSGPALQANIVLERTRAARQLAVLSGYELPRSLIDGLVLQNLTEIIVDTARHGLAPIIVHDSCRAFDLKQQLSVQTIEMGEAQLAEIENGSAGEQSVPEPTLDQIRSHGRFLVTTEVPVLLQMHRFMRGPGASLIIEHWRASLTRLQEDEPEQADLAAQAMLRLDTLELSKPARAVTVANVVEDPSFGAGPNFGEGMDLPASRSVKLAVQAATRPLNGTKQTVTQSLPLADTSAKSLDQADSPTASAPIVSAGKGRKSCIAQQARADSEASTAKSPAAAQRDNDAVAAAVARAVAAAEKAAEAAKQSALADVRRQAEDDRRASIAKAVADAEAAAGIAKEAAIAHAVQTAEAAAQAAREAAVAEAVRTATANAQAMAEITLDTALGAARVTAEADKEAAIAKAISQAEAAAAIAKETAVAEAVRNAESAADLATQAAITDAVRNAVAAAHEARDTELILAVQAAEDAKNAAIERARSEAEAAAEQAKDIAVAAAVQEAAKGADENLRNTIRDLKAVHQVALQDALETCLRDAEAAADVARSEAVAQAILQAQARSEQDKDLAVSEAVAKATAAAEEARSAALADALATADAEKAAAIEEALVQAAAAAARSESAAVARALAEAAATAEAAAAARAEAEARANEEFAAKLKSRQRAM
jgi:hypothetical protein